MNDHEDATATASVGDGESVAEAVVRTVAAVSGAAPMPERPSENGTLEPLYSVIDPEALDAVFRPDGDKLEAGGRVCFPYHGYRVTVHGDDRITVRPQEGAAD